MNKNIEKELKILISKEKFNKLVNKYEPLQFKTQINTYYDTFNNDIRNKKGAMRIRTIDSTYIFTLKIHSDDGLLEYECIVENDSLSVFKKKEIVDLLSKYDIKPPFHKIAQLKTRRAIFENEFAELCFDENFYNDTIDYEIEYEYKKEHDGVYAFNQILDYISIKYEKNCISKIQRALLK